MNETAVNCRDLDANFDAYVDAALPAERLAELAAHVRCCQRCDEIVTRYQEARTLLTAAVAESAAAVDVSGLWDAIERELDTTSPRLGWRGLFAGVWERWWPLPAESLGWRVGGALATAAAVLAILAALLAQPVNRAQVAASANAVQAVRIDSMEVAPGYTVATWMRPRKHTTVIWISEDQAGFRFTPASAGR